MDTRPARFPRSIAPAPRPGRRSATARSRAPLTGLALSALALALAAGLGGCLNPGTIQPVARQNATNIANYNANVAKLLGALRRQAGIQGELQVQVARNAVAAALIAQLDTWNGPADPPGPTLVDFRNEALQPHKSLKADLQTAQAMPRATPDDAALIERRYPLLAHVVTADDGADVASVVMDAFTLKRLNRELKDETTDPESREILFRKRNHLLDRYAPVRREREAADAALAALDAVLADIREQGEIAAVHADAITRFSQATPESATLASAFRDQELRDRIISRVAPDRRGSVAGFFAKADRTFDLIEGLRK